MNRTFLPATLILAGVFLAAGCSRGIPREKRQVVVIPDMEVQKKLKPQGASPLFEDGRAMRLPPAGTVARGSLKEDQAFYFGKRDTSFVERAPVPYTAALLERGRDRFNIYCSPCHDRTGGGHGTVARRGHLVPPPKLWDERVRNHPDGKIFDIITHGIRTMPAYGHQIRAADRWAIVSYVRALQRAQTATLDDVPADKLREIR